MARVSTNVRDSHYLVEMRSRALMELFHHRTVYKVANIPNDYVTRVPLLSKGFV